jgi:tail-anchored protein insertion receptor
LLTQIRTAAAASSSRASFDTKATALRWTLTSGLRLAIQFYHAKTPVFTYPRGWFPWYIEWLLGFPRCPYGGVSVNVWSTACAGVIAIAGEVVAWIVGMGLQKQNARQKEKVPVGEKSR